MAVHDGADHLVRAVESILNQDFADFELIIADCASTDRTPSILSNFHDRDIRVELIERDDPGLAEGVVAAIDASRGSFVMLVRADDWLAPNALGSLVELAEDHRLDMVVEDRSEDLWDPKDRSSSSQRLTAGACVLEGRAEVRHGVPALYEQGLLSQATGLLIERGRAFDHRLALSVTDEGLAFVVSCLEDAERVGVCDASCYHCVSTSVRGQRPFDPAFAARIADEHAQMMGLLRTWGLDHDAAATVPVHRHHVRRLIECIDNAIMGSSRISSIERIGRVQEILDAEDARASLAAVQPAAEDFGIMYKPMAQGNAASCCVSARLRDFVRSAHLPLPQLL